MYIDQKYPFDFDKTAKIDIPEYDLANSGYFYGCMSQTTDSIEKKTYFNIPHYSMVYVIKGSATYIDKRTKKQYNVTPGCIIQHMPNTPHYSIINKNTYWREFYITGSRYVFEALAKSGVISREPVFYLGESEDIHEKFIQYDEKHKNFDINNIYKMIPDFVDVVLFAHNYKKNSQNNVWEQNINKILKQHINVNISVREIANMHNMDYEKMRKQFKKDFGCSINEYRIKLRIDEAIKLMLEHNMPVNEVAYKLGYCDAYAFSKQFKKLMGVSPKQYVLNHLQQ